MAAPRVPEEPPVCGRTKTFALDWRRRQSQGFADHFRSKKARFPDSK